MSYDSLGCSYCSYCGAQFRLFTIFKKDMGGLCKGWKRRHERKCSRRTPSERLKWAKKYVGLTTVDSSITVDINHEGFKEPSC